MHISVSFIVITYQRGDLLRSCLESIYDQRGLPGPVEVIVIDNGGDAVIDPSPASDIRLRVERPAENLGAAGGRNLAMDLAEGEFWLFIDDDATWHDEQDAARMLALLQAESSIGAVAVKSLAPDGQPIVIEYPHPNKAFIARQTSPVDVPYFYTMGLALRASAIHQAGKYPKRFGIYMEEVDLSYRVADAGYRIVYAPDAAVIHYRSDQGRPVHGDRYWFQSALNKSRLAWRLLPLPYPLTILFVWSGWALVKTRRLRLVLDVWRTLWQERDLLRRERAPIQRDTVRRLQRVGARLLY